MKRAAKPIATVSLSVYLKKESVFALKNLQKAEKETIDRMNSFQAKCVFHKIALTNFEEVMKNYEKVIREAQVAKTQKELLHMKKVTACLEITADNITKMLRGFDYRFRRLISEAKKAKSGTKK
ncbi:unnamed protein product [Caenorhabditis sp. 36 PRJEB53466]|nr:unnamed protein product [Caenorhabditis sp. 36 PRJEB53466]